MCVDAPRIQPYANSGDLWFSALTHGNPAFVCEPAFSVSHFSVSHFSVSHSFRCRTLFGVALFSVSHFSVASVFAARAWSAEVKGQEPGLVNVLFAKRKSN